LVGDSIMLETLLKRAKLRKEERQEFVREHMNKLVSQSEEIVMQRLKSRESIVKDIISAKKLGTTINPSILELMKEPGEEYDEPLGFHKGSVRAMLAIWVCLGFLITTMLLMFLIPLPLEYIFEMWKLLSVVFVVVIGSYFYSRIKMGGIL
jgi:hypothetical protein